MTTISLKQGNKFSLVIKLLVFGVSGLFLTVMYLYNINVNLRHEIEDRSDILRKITISNADLKDKLYKMTDIVMLKSLILKRNLTEDKNPYYFKEGALLWVAVH